MMKCNFWSQVGSALIVLSACANACGAKTYQPWEAPPRQIVINPKAAITATPANLEIVVASSAYKTTKFAATELKFFLDRVFNQAIPVVSAPTPHKISIILGLNSWSKAAQFDETKLIPDSFFIKRMGNKIFIAGKDSSHPRVDPARYIEKEGVWAQLYDRGTLYGVYDFVERFAGVKMYFPGELGTIIPQKKALSIPAIDIYERPDCSQRKVSSFWDGTYFEGKNPNAYAVPGKTLNSYRLRLATTYIPCCHGTRGFRYVERFGKSHPEYFALRQNGQRCNDPNGGVFKGHLCWTSKVMDEMYQDVKAYLTGQPAASRGLKFWWVNCQAGKYVDIMPQDSFQACQCPKCQQVFSKEHYYATDAVWSQVARIANRLKKEHVKGYVTQMAYFPYRGIPKVEIPDNVLVMVAERGPWSVATPQHLAHDNAEIKAWTRKLNRKVWLWNYTNKFSTLEMPGIPQMSPHAYGAYYQQIGPWIFGAFAESESDRFLYNYLNYYIFSKVLWNTKVDYKKLIDEHFSAMFGRAAAPMQKFYDTLEQIWVHKIAGRMVDTNAGPVGAPPTDYKIWHEIYDQATINGLNQLLLQAQRQVAKNSLEARRIALMRREFYDNLVAARTKYLQKNQAVKGLKCYISAQPGKALYLSPFNANKKTKVFDPVTTQVQVWRNATELSVKFTCAEPQMARLMAIKRAKDDVEIWKDNSVEVLLNPSGDRKTYYHLMLNSAGAVTDQKCIRQGLVSQFDRSWDSQAQVSIKNFKDHWEIVVVIPLRNLPGIQAEFPANFARNRVLKSGKYQIFYSWSRFIRDFHDVENFGSITTRPDHNILGNSDFSRPAVGGRFFAEKRGSYWYGWVGENASDQQLDYTTFISGPCSMKLVGGMDKNRLTAYHVPLKPNTRYRLSFYLKMDQVKPRFKPGSKYQIFGVHANVWDVKNLWFPKRNFMAGTTDWNYYSFEFTTHPQTNAQGIRSYLRLGYFNVSGTVWLDDVRLEEVK